MEYIVIATIASAFAACASAFTAGIGLCASARAKKAEYVNDIVKELMAIKREAIQIDEYNDSARDMFISAYLDIFEWYSYLANNKMIGDEKTYKFFNETFLDISGEYLRIKQEKPEKYVEIERYIISQKLVLEKKEEEV